MPHLLQRAVLPLDGVDAAQMIRVQVMQAVVRRVRVAADAHGYRLPRYAVHDAPDDGFTGLQGGVGAGVCTWFAQACPERCRRRGGIVFAGLRVGRVARPPARF